MSAAIATLLASLETFLAVYDILKWIVSLLERNKWINEGRAQVWREQLESMKNEVRKARAADAAVSDDPDSVQNDPNNRDRDTNS